MENNISPSSATSKQIALTTLADLAQQGGDEYIRLQAAGAILDFFKKAA